MLVCRHVTLVNMSIQISVHNLLIINDRVLRKKQKCDTKGEKKKISE